MRGPAKIGVLIEECLKRHNLEREVKLRQLLERWGELVGPLVARRSQPAGFRNQILFVRVASPAWMQELSASGLKEKLMEEINGRLGTPRIKGVRFSVGEIEAPTPASPVVPPSQELSQEGKSWIDKIVSPVKDMEVRGVLERALAGYIRRKGA